MLRFNVKTIVASGLAVLASAALLTACGGSGSGGASISATTSSSDSGGTDLPVGGPSIAIQPRTASVNDGQSASFSVVATGTGPITYQWQRNGADIAGATDSAYSIAAVTLADYGAVFTVVVTDAVASVTSRAVILTVAGAAPVTSSQPPSSAMKWHPGHYVMSLANNPVTPTNQPSIWLGPMNDMRTAINPATGKPGFAGWVGNYSWFYLEPPSPGPFDQGSTSYNTSLIDNDLAQLAQLSAADGVTYRLIILVMTETWTAAPIPPAPQGAPYGAANNSGSVVPDFLIDGISGNGSDVIAQSDNGGGYDLSLWRPAVMTRYIALLNYLGAKYDSNPNVEAIIPVSETGVPLTSSLPADYSSSAWDDQYQNMAAFMSTSWPTTNKIFDDNWGVPGDPLPALSTQYAAIAANAGWGFGGPDVIYLAPYGVLTPLSGVGGNETSGEAVIRGEGSGYGDTLYKGAVPLAFQVQANAYTWLNQTSAGTESYGYSSLGVTHFIWVDLGTNGTSTQDWSGILSALGNVGYRINTACPSKYVNGCTN